MYVLINILLVHCISIFPPTIATVTHTKGHLPALHFGKARHSRNIALGKHTYQSSVAYGGIPGRAVDGNFATNWRSRTCTHTKNQYRAWWMVDLGRKYYINSVSLTNRGDCCCKHVYLFMFQLYFNKNFLFQNVYIKVDKACQEANS